MFTQMERLRYSSFWETHEKIKEYEEFDDPKTLKLIYEYNAQ